MRVLHIGKFFPPPYGGIETHTLALVNTLKRDIQVDLLVSNTCAANENFHADGYEVFKVATWATVASTPICPSMITSLRRLIREKSYDIVHLHFPNPMAHLASYFMPKGVKLVITWHSDIIRQKNLLKLYRPFLNNIINRADAIIAPTPKHFSSSTQLQVAKDKSRFHVVPFGLDLSQFNETPAVLKRAQELRDEQGKVPVIFSFGRHIYYKGFEYLIQAMKEVKGAVLWLGGVGPLTEKYRELAQDLKIDDRIKFLGKIPPEDLAAYYHAADVFCLSSVDQSEAFGLVQVEAMASKKPVVCCELDNGVTYVNRHGETGLVVPPRDPASLAEALNKLIADEKLRSTFGTAAYNWVHSEFTLEKMGREMIALYRQLML